MTKLRPVWCRSDVLAVLICLSPSALAAQPDRPPIQFPEASLEQQVADEQISQFQLPRPGPGGAQPPPPRFLQFEYSWGSEVQVPYRKNYDLNRRVEDDSAVAFPTVFGTVTYRPNDWLETLVEATLEKPIGIREEEIVVLPDGTLQGKQSKQLALTVDQAYVKVKTPDVPAEFTLGRRAFGNRRTFGGDRSLWLIEGSLDAVHGRVKPGDFNLEASVSRQDFKELDLINHPPRGTVNNFILQGEYRGLEDHTLEAYYIYRRDTAAVSDVGRPKFSGVRAMGRPTDALNYWADLAAVRGHNETNEKLQGHGYQLGGIFRFLNLPWRPSLIGNYAFGSGDGTPGNGKDHQFRQTGLHLNEATFSGLTVAKTYGEVFDPEMSNLQIITAGFGFRPAARMFVDVVYQRYKMDQIAETIRGTPITAELNQVNGQASKDVGEEIDVIVGFRNVFGIRGFGLDFRMGWFFPGRAYLRDDNGVAVQPDMATSFMAVVLF
jgi:alginate production protein